MVAKLNQSPSTLSTLQLKADRGKGPPQTQSANTLIAITLGPSSTLHHSDVWSVALDKAQFMAGKACLTVCAAYLQHKSQRLRHTSLL